MSLGATSVRAPEGGHSPSGPGAKTQPPGRGWASHGAPGQWPFPPREHFEGFCQSIGFTIWSGLTASTQNSSSPGATGVASSGNSIVAKVIKIRLHCTGFRGELIRWRCPCKKTRHRDPQGRGQAWSRAAPSQVHAGLPGAPGVGRGLGALGLSPGLLGRE